MVLERVLAGRIAFTPRADGLGYDFVANTQFDKLFTGIAHGITIPGFTSRDWVPSIGVAKPLWPRGTL